MRIVPMESIGPHSFIDIKRAYDRIPREVVVGFEKKRFPLKYIKLIKDMYDGVVTNVRTNEGIRNEFPKFQTVKLPIVSKI